MLKKKIHPALKWAGGKTQLLDIISENIPVEYKNYYEPFFGGGAVLFGLTPSQAFVNDINAQLINLYVQIKRSADSVIAKVNEMDAMPCTKEIYYAARTQYNAKIENHELDAECAALMIWINKHCFNGLYRVNRQGLFNVPYNNKVGGRSIDESNIRDISMYLQKADITITCLDFENACDGVEADDFVYFDSPYVPQSVTSSFTDYAVDGFSLLDHERLAALFKRLDKIGAKIMLSNNDVPLVHSLYHGYNIQSIDVKRMINSNSSKRTGKEVLITNY